MWMAYVPYSTLSDLITIWTCLLLSCLLSGMCGKLFNKGDYAFSFDLKDTYLHIPIVKHHHCFLQFVWQHKPYQWKILFFLGWLWPLGFHFTKPVLSHHRGLHAIIYLDDSLVLTYSKSAGK